MYNTPQHSATLRNIVPGWSQLARSAFRCGVGIGVCFIVATSSSASCKSSPGESAELENRFRQDPASEMEREEVAEATGLGTNDEGEVAE